MYRPNRVGPWPIIDIDEPPQTITSLSIQANASEFFPRMKQVVVREEFEQWTVRMTNDETISRDRRGGLGIAINGVQENELNWIYALRASMQMKSDRPLQVGMVLGRSATQSIGGIVRVVKYHYLPCEITQVWTPTNATAGFLITHVNLNTEIIQGHVQQGTYTADDEYPLILAMIIQNESTLGATIHGLNGSIGIHKYTQDVDTWDPSR